MTTPLDAQREVSAGGVVYRVVDAAPLYLLIRDSYRNWGFPKGHLECDEDAPGAAVREVQEETGLPTVTLCAEIDTIDWYFRFRGKLVHKICHFFLMETDCSAAAARRRHHGLSLGALPRSTLAARVRKCARGARTCTGNSRSPRRNDRWRPGVVTQRCTSSV